ncbi:MAG: hypothetical protein CFE29_04570 [Bradyrhizobiaceae bacterium PARB1]|nr:MAG: hypothetical protein CFE29_04570 [Bradyrhizobiaceae bacterium PARB1]
MTSKRSPHCPSCGAEAGFTVAYSPYRSRGNLDGVVIREVTFSCSHKNDCRDANLRVACNFTFDHKAGTITLLVEGNESWFENRYARRAAGERVEDHAPWTSGVLPKVGDTVIMFGEPKVVKSVTVAG